MDKIEILRVVQTQTVLFLKSMSERGDSKSIEGEIIQIQSRPMSDPPLSDIDFKNKMVLVWTTLKNIVHFNILFGSLDRIYGRNRK